MTWLTAFRVLLVLSTMLSASCGARTGLGESFVENPDDAAIRPDAQSDADDAAGDEPVAKTQCGCSGRADFQPCVAPFECCPCNDDGLGWYVNRCRNPATFNCSCTHVLQCPPP